MSIVTATPAQTIDTPDLRKARGAFFTPGAIARHVTEWAVRTPSDRILEPSCGEAAFLLAASHRLADLGLPDSQLSTGVLHGVELHEASAASARSLLTEASVPVQVTTADFFSVAAAGDYDAVIGNPPYVRYQDFSGESRTRSRAAALRGGVSLSGLASSWAAFTVHSAQFLRTGGRLGLVLPAELLSVNYAAEVRRFLLEKFGRVDLVMFTERVFPGVLEDVVLLMADGYMGGPTDHASVYQAQNADDLGSLPTGSKWRPRNPQDKWTPSLMPVDALEPYSHLVASDWFAELEDWGDTTLGMVTGNNKYFALSPQRVRDRGLKRSDLIRLSPPGSRHLRGLELTSGAYSALGRQGASTWLFRPEAPSSAAWAYIEAGEAAGANEAYKCRVRTPWWRVPLVRPADLFLTYMNADTARISTNTAGAHHLNSVHGVYLKPDHQALGLDLLPIASLNSVTLLGAEMVGRAYGGGMLKLEPREADRLPVPSPEFVAAHADALRAAKPQVAGFLRAGRLLEAVATVDRVLLRDAAEVGISQIDSLGAAHAALFARRVARGSGS